MWFYTWIAGRGTEIYLLASLKNALVSIWLNNLWFTGQADEGRRTTPQPTKLG
jgi:hypothetical protein